MVVQPRRGRVSVLSETQNDALFLRLHLIKSGQRPQQSRDGGDTPRAFRGKTAFVRPAVHDPAHLVLTFFQQSFDIRRNGVILTRTPRVLIVVIIAPRAFVFSHVTLP